MKKTAMILLVVAMTLTMAVTTWAKFKATCKVKAIQEQKVILDCDEKLTKLKVDDLVKVSQKNKKPKEQIEGC